MTFFRSSVLTLVLGCFAFSAMPAHAETTASDSNCGKTKVVRQVKPKAARKALKKATATSASIRAAQEQLQKLGYYMGSVDGVAGPQFRAALKAFQKDHGLKADGVLGPKTRKALDDATRGVYRGGKLIPMTDVLPTQVTGLPSDGEVHQDYQTSLNGQTKALSSRFARVDVSETGQGADKRYTVSVNGQAILAANGQPSVIGISKVYDMCSHDAIVLTTFSPDELSNCTYRSHVLTLNGSGMALHDIQNCTRHFDAEVNNCSLFVSFTEPGTNRATPAVWRMEGQSLNRM